MIYSVVKVRDYTIADELMMSTELLHSVVIEAACALSIVSHTNAWRVMYVSMTQLGLPSPRVHIMASSRDHVNRSLQNCNNSVSH